MLPHETGPDPPLCTLGRQQAPSCLRNGRKSCCPMGPTHQLCHVQINHCCHCSQIVGSNWQCLRLTRCYLFLRPATCKRWSCGKHDGKRRPGLWNDSIHMRWFLNSYATIVVSPITCSSPSKAVQGFLADSRIIWFLRCGLKRNLELLDDKSSQGSLETMFLPNCDNEFWNVW